MIANTDNLSKVTGVWDRIAWKDTEPKETIFSEWLQLCTLPIGFFYFSLHIYGCLRFLANDKSWAALGIAISLVISATTMTILRWNFKRMAEHEDDKLSLAMLVRFYVASSFSVFVLFMNGLKFPRVCIYFWIPSGILGFYFVLRPGTFREKVLKFCFLWPFRTNEDVSEASNMDRLDQLVWFLRFAFTTIAIGSADGLWRKTLNKTINSTLGAGFHEEAYKLLLTGTIFMIPKYSRSRLALLYVSFIVGLGFGLAEDVVYVMKYGPSVFGRLITVFAHSGFNFFIALAVARQRDSIIWWIELFIGISCAVAWHACSNYIAVLAGQNDDAAIFAIFYYVIAKPIMTYGIFFFILITQSVYPFKLRLRCQSKNTESGDADPHVSSPELGTPIGTVTAKDETV